MRQIVRRRSSKSSSLVTGCATSGSTSGRSSMTPPDANGANAATREGPRGKSPALVERQRTTGLERSDHSRPFTRLAPFRGPAPSTREAGIRNDIGIRAEPTRKWRRRHSQFRRSLGIRSGRAHGVVDTRHGGVGQAVGAGVYALHRRRLEGVGQAQDLDHQVGADVAGWQRWICWARRRPSWP